MGQPILLLVTDQDRVLEALASDVGRRFGAEYRILVERSPVAALATLERLAAQSEEVALLIAAQRMREMTGVDFIVRAHELHPTAKRVLLVGRREWTPTNPAVRAMTLGQIDDYLFEPWLPLGRWLYLPITQVLADWVPSQAPSFEGIRIVGPRWGSRAHELRDMLTRMGIPHGWYLADSQAGRELLQEAGQDGSRLPVVVFHSGRVFVDPSNAELAEGLGFGTQPAAAAYDLVIVGAGPAGLAAAVYAASEGLQTLVVEPRVVGGQAGTSALIRNYLGFPRGIGGGVLANRAGATAWCGCRTAARSQPPRWSSQAASPGGAWACRGSRRCSARACSTARPERRHGPWRVTTSTWLGRGTPPARHPCTWQGTPLR